MWNLDEKLRRMATRNNSSPYILPRRTPNSARPGTFITTRNLSTLHIQPRPTPFLSGTISKSSPQPLRVVGRIIDPMTLGSSRQILLAPSSAVLSPAEQFPNVQPQRTPLFKLGQDQSEEDEFDLDEMYRLLDESAGYRAQEMSLPRRRERLNNLSQEEKINRRKHKNRIAAQAARDRKKVNTHRLEESLRRALVEIGRLRGEVNLLRGENTRLEAENQTIRFGKEKSTVPDQCNTDTFERHNSKHEPSNYEENHLAPQRKMQRQFRPQRMLNHHQQTIDMKPSFLVRPAEQMKKADGVGQRDSQGQQKQRQWKAKTSGEEGVRDGMCGQSAHGAVAGGEDVELQKIFDELFEDFDFPVDVDRFCNEVIEEGIAESSDAFGAVKIDASQQQQTNCGNGCMPPTDATESQAESSAQAAYDEQCEFGWEQCRVGGGQQQHHGLRSRTAVAAALSPHNYFAHLSPQTSSSSACASVSTLSSETNPSSNNSPSPTYQKVPSPCLSSHSTFIDEFASPAFDDDQHNFVHFRQIDSETDPLFNSSVKQEYFEQFDEHLPITTSFGFEESMDWNNGFDSLGAEESCTLGEEAVMAVNEEPNGDYGQQSLLDGDDPISFYGPPSPDHFTFLSY
ncbi:hypothetical protein niasHT_015635 [Heterodera trifolii]|uniref:X-box-binding protein 1 n=1 Tax=Heterodera trifolii TaxID=157864 RepID=A0ABD2L476_9BILA